MIHGIFVWMPAFLQIEFGLFKEISFSETKLFFYFYRVFYLIHHM